MPAILALFLCLVLFCCASSENGAAMEEEPANTFVPAVNQPVLHIPLRIHLGESNWRPAEFIPVAREMSDIWLRQAGICFETEIVLHDKAAVRGFDLWIEPKLQENQSYNGLYNNDHDIRVRDVPILGDAAHSAKSPTARTAAHEIGHALRLHHRQDSDDNLMRSKTFGWQLNAEEIRKARKAALAKALLDKKSDRCRISDKVDEDRR
ncbi:MAG TPA: hypothetical protein VK445_08935 [Dissulfurispiraceae bacterium]|nr:hypothetical protein [Dissulfurispiraceae bacterium]